MNLASIRGVARRSGGLMGAAVCISAAVLAWIGYRSVEQWEDAAQSAALSRAQAAADLLASAITRDMRGTEQLVLATAQRDSLVGEPAVDLVPAIGSAFARYPYPAAFFSWQGDPAPDFVTFYARADRTPEWLPHGTDHRLTPVVSANEPGVAARILKRVDEDVKLCKRSSVFDLDIAGAPYQAVAVISYDSLCEQVRGVLGFLVNLDWVRQFYFADLAEQITQLAGGAPGPQLLVFDDRGNPVVSEDGDSWKGAPIAKRTFPLVFFDPLVHELDPPPDLHIRTWTAAAAVGGDPALLVSRVGARRTLGIDAAMLLVLVVALVFGARAARASADLAEMRSEFVSTVTHELKTPISNIRAINETLASGRGSAEMSREYAELAIGEAKRLSRLIDNLLAYAKITDVTDAYFFEDVSLDSVVKQTLAELGGQLTQARFVVSVQIAPDLPDVRADPTALGLVLSNVIDNAIRYSTDNRRLEITAMSEKGSVRLDIHDHGVGIPTDEIPRVTRKFFRGRSSHSAGSGLGLAIVERIVHAHSGSLDIRSTVGAGTTVSITLPQGSAI